MKDVSSQADTFTPSQYYFNSDHNITSVEEKLIINLLLSIYSSSFYCVLLTTNKSSLLEWHLSDNNNKKYSLLSSNDNLENFRNRLIKLCGNKHAL